MGVSGEWNHWGCVMRLGNASSKMNRLRIVTACGIVLLIAAAVVVAARNRQRPLPPSDVHVASTPRAVRVKAVDGKDEAVAQLDAAEVSALASTSASPCLQPPESVQGLESCLCLSAAGVWSMRCVRDRQPDQARA